MGGILVYPGPGHNATRHSRIYPVFPDSPEWAHTTPVPTHGGFEQGRNDYERLERRWPASTGWLIASILFAHKLWIMDVTSMSLYWVARLPIDLGSRLHAFRPRADPRVLFLSR